MSITQSQARHKGRKPASFYGTALPRPALLLDKQQNVIRARIDAPMATNEPLLGGRPVLELNSALPGPGTSHEKVAKQCATKAPTVISREGGQLCHANLPGKNVLLGSAQRSCR